MTEQNYSQRRACALAGIDPRVYRYRSIRPDDAAVRVRLRELALERRRFGYRRLHILLRREGVQINWKKLYRLYKEEGLMVRKRGGRKRALGTRAPMTVPQGPNQRWSLDFVSDTLVDGRKFRILCVIDDFSRECLATVVDNSLSGVRVARELNQIARCEDCPIWWSVTMERSSLPMRSSSGSRTARPGGITLPLESQCRMALSKASTVASGTNA
jgi:putative transposase